MCLVSSLLHRLGANGPCDGENSLPTRRPQCGPRALRAREGACAEARRRGVPPDQEAEDHRGDGSPTGTTEIRKADLTGHDRTVRRQKVVEASGVEPPTSSLRTTRSPNRATPPGPAAAKRHSFYYTAVPMPGQRHLSAITSRPGPARHRRGTRLSVRSGRWATGRRSSCSAPTRSRASSVSIGVGPRPGSG